MLNLRLAVGIALVVGVLGPAFGQGSAADYRRADELPGRFRGKVLNDDIRPQWVPGTSSFTYLREMSNGGSQIILVQPEKGTREPAFDHKALASALGRELARTIDPDRLPIERFELEGQTLHFMIREDFRIWSYGGGRLSHVPVEQSQRFRIPSLPRVAPSRDNGEQVYISFINLSDVPLDVFWISREGQSTQYGTLEPRSRRVQHTFSGHVWQLKDKQGTSYGIFRAEVERGLAIASKPSTPPPPPALQPAAGTSPDGAFRVIIRENNVFLRDVKAGQEHQLTTDGSPENSYARSFWAPDSKRFVVLQTEPAQQRTVSIVESSPNSQLQPVLHQMNYLKPGDKVAHPRPVLFDAINRKRIAVDDSLFPNPYALDSYSWSGDSKQFFFRYNQRGHQVLRMLSIDGETGQVKTIIEDKSNTFIDYAGKNYMAYSDSSKEYIWMSERDGWNHLYLIDSQTGKVKSQITKGNWVVRGVTAIDGQKRQLTLQIGGYYPDQDPYYVHYARVNWDGTGFTMLTEGDGTHSIQFSPDGKYIFDSYSRVDMAPVTELRDAQTGRLVTTLEKGDLSPLVAAGWKMPERFMTTARDSKTPIYGVIYRPSNFDPAKSYPVIENIYAGPQGAFTPKAFSEAISHQQLAELGFIVVQLDGMGTSQRSKAFHDVCWKNLADAGFPDRIKWIKAAAATRPWMDVTKVGIYGTSAGGQNALGGLLTHPDFYKAGVADCGCHDNRMDKIWWNELWMSWPVGKEYDEQSNVTLAKNLKGDLLLMVGEMDTNVDPASTMQVVDALIKANKDFELLVAPGVGHGVAGTPYGRRRLYDFFVRSLLKKEPRW